MSKNVVILGSTGSIGTQALSVCERMRYNVLAISGNNNIDLLVNQALQHKPQYVCIKPALHSDLKIRLAHTNCKVLSTEDGICEIVALEKADIVLNGIVGIAGLLPTISAIKAKKRIALANKESLVVAGKLIKELAEKNHVQIIPVDSEHSAIFQCLQAGKRNEVRKIILTASGGPFFGKDKAELKYIKKEQALTHPNWTMGAKITIDSATLMNKGLEFIEATELFQMDNIEIIIHRESVIHSAVEFRDGSIIAQMGTPTMETPIQYALTYPVRQDSPLMPLSLTDYSTLSFYKPDYDTFDCLKACMLAYEKGGLSPCVANGANEKAVELFLQDKISFLDIGEKVLEAVENIKTNDNYNLEDIINIDKLARERVVV